ncbi:hypothetical protein DAPPUDRAFT_308781 [Daphnia pulex]|uniref:WAP domain-containing protein n=1 Tax=Daphnia pulex TaxID=6669 RepID=E9H9J9_DAPPU|nr:hypothetical protein DAPPUDRAFT_308781 [Daphnia pulex]|eukprot:EFX71638.1 hypothetical protein DAPPUDRAFT_308781 [Daphnia pulex]
MFQKFFLLACILAVMAIVYTNSLPTEEGENDETFCKPFSSCTNSTDCSSNLIYKTCRANLFGNKQCCL